MPLTPGTKLGQYEVIESIGAGGMEKCTRPRIFKLGRDVAIKVLSYLRRWMSPLFCRTRRTATL